jgi:hypothetical protein
VHSETRIKTLRGAALLAALAQLWPCYVALQTSFIHPSIVMDEGIIGWLWGGLSVFSSCAMFVFYVATLSSPAPMLVPPALRGVALFAAAMIGLQNAQMTVANLQAVVVRSMNPLQWKYHAMGQLWHVLQPLLPIAWVAFTIVFLVMASRLRCEDQGVRPAAKRSVSLVTTSALLACVAAGAELIAILYMDLRFFRLLTVQLVLQVAIDVSLLLFFVLMYRAKPSYV